MYLGTDYNDVMLAFKRTEQILDSAVTPLVSPRYVESFLYLMPYFLKKKKKKYALLFQGYKNSAIKMSQY